MARKEHNAVKRRTAELIDRRFGNLVILGEAGRSGAHVVVDTLCDCGARSTKRLDTLKSGRVVSCGCVGRQRYRDYQNNKAARVNTGLASRVFDARCSDQTDAQIAASCRIDPSLVGFIFRRRAGALLKQHETFIAANLNRDFSWLAKAMVVSVIEASWMVKRTRAALKAAAQTASTMADHAFSRIARVKATVSDSTILPGRMLSFARRLRKHQNQLGTIAGMHLDQHTTTPEKIGLLAWFRQAISDTIDHRRQQRFQYLQAVPAA